MKFPIRSVSTAFDALALTSQAATITHVHWAGGLLGCWALRAEQRPRLFLWIAAAS